MSICNLCIVCTPLKPCMLHSLIAGIHDIRVGFCTDTIGHNTFLAELWGGQLCNVVRPNWKLFNTHSIKTNTALYMRTMAIFVRICV